MVSHIIAAYDGSEESADAVEHACEIGNALGASLSIVYAVQPDVYEAAGGEVGSNFADEYRREILRTIDEAEVEAQEELEAAATIADEHGADASTELLYGDPAIKILDHAVSADADMIVLGHRGRSGAADARLGSVAKAVIERAAVPVTVTR